jgi:PIN domain nuclease of toxin-antitoxin system
VKFLLDTHTFLWIGMDDARLSNNARDIIRNRQNALYLSAASIWEIAIKWSLGKLRLELSPEEFIREEMTRNNILTLSIEIAHALKTVALPRHHEDPFDRMLIAQACHEDLQLLSRDSTLARYDVKVI